MIAHSLPDPAFGPAQQLHGATYVVDVAFEKPDLDKHNIVIDIGLAAEVLKKALQPLAYQNLDDLPAFEGKLTTTEFLARHIHSSICQLLRRQIECMLTVTLGESHVAWASYRGRLE